MDAAALFGVTVSFYIRRLSLRSACSSRLRGAVRLLLQSGAELLRWLACRGVGKRSDLQMYGTSKLYNVLAVKEIGQRLKGALRLERRVAFVARVYVNGVL